MRRPSSPPPSSVVPARVRTLRDGAGEEREDRLAAEAPLEVRIGRSSTVLLRTPGHDEDLVRGFLFCEGVVETREEVRALVRPPRLPRGAAGNVIVADLDVPVDREGLRRAMYSSSACGACGKASLASLAIRTPPLTADLSIPAAVLRTLPERLRAAQDAFRETGGLHATGLFTPAGGLLCLREDVGRHNAFDKVVGWALEAGRLPLSGAVALVSGRVSYEIVQKALAAGIPILAAVGAPSSLAVELAGRYGLTLAGFLRPGSMNIYSRADRIAE